MQSVDNGNTLNYLAKQNGTWEINHQSEKIMPQTNLIRLPPPTAGKQLQATIITYTDAKDFSETVTAFKSTALKD